MQLQSILNRVERHKGFVYKKVRWDETAVRPTLVVQVESRRNSRPVCAGCGRRGSIHSRLQPRRWEFVPLWQICVVLEYARRRIRCPQCGVKTEAVPWGEGKCRQTISYRWFLARWARRLSWKETAEIFHTSWDTVFRAVSYAVRWGIVHRDVTDVVAIGVDEIQWQRGHKYLTVVYQIDARVRRLLWVGEGRSKEVLNKFFDHCEDDIKSTLKYVCSDMWRQYLDVIADRAGYAIHVLDRYHIMARMNKAIDHVRAGEARKLKADGYEPILKHSRWCLLKRPENRTDKQTVKMKELLKYNLQAVRAHLLREDFQRFWQYKSVAWAGKFLRQWCRRTMLSKLEPMKDVARSLRDHEELLMNWFRAKGEISAGIVEGLNNKAKLTIRKAYGFRTLEANQVALYHQLAKLPEPNDCHRFC